MAQQMPPVQASLVGEERGLSQSLRRAPDSVLAVCRRAGRGPHLTPGGLTGAQRHHAPTWMAKDRANLASRFPTMLKK